MRRRPAPIVFFWDGAVMAPLLRCFKAAQQRFQAGEQYRMWVEHDRSQASHNAYFAELTEQWRKLLWGPRGADFPTVEHLRHHALIRTGFCDIASEELPSAEAAERMAAFLRGLDALELAEVSSFDNCLTIKTAVSQSRAVMGTRGFQASKAAVLDYVARLVGRDAPAIEAD
jgi:hypothetical protein